MMNVKQFRIFIIIIVLILFRFMKEFEKLQKICSELLISKIDN